MFNDVPQWTVFSQDKLIKVDCNLDLTKLMFSKTFYKTGYL